jgi:Ni,Fe-hydrogenase I cytochrome b subunit
MSDDDNRPVTGPDWSYRHNYNTRICHWVNAVAIAQMPAFNAIAPGLIEFFGGRQTARTLHAVGMLLILGFVVVHVLQVFLTGAGNEIRAMVTGSYRRPESRGNGR